MCLILSHCRKGLERVSDRHSDKINNVVLNVIFRFVGAQREPKNIGKGHSTTQ